MNSAVNNAPASAPSGLRTVNLEDAALGGERVGKDAQRSDARANSDLRNRPHIRQRQFDGDLIEAPDDTKNEDERRGKRIEGTGMHRSPSPLGSAKSRAAGLSLDPPPSLAAQRIKCVSGVPRRSASGDPVEGRTSPLLARP